MEGQLDDLRAANRKREAQLRTRRLFLMGSYIERIAERDPEARERLLRGLDGFLAKARERLLFDLPPSEGTDG